MITYRDARPVDADVLAAFSAASFSETFAHLYPPAHLAAYLAEKYAPARQRAEIEGPNTHYRLAFEGAALVGYCLYGAMTLPVERTDENAAELHRLYVGEAVKGAGVAAALMQHVLGWARGQGAGALYLGVWENNQRAQRFYRRYGFVHVGEHAFMVGGTKDRDYIWRLSLDGAG